MTNLGSTQVIEMDVVQVSLVISLTVNASVGLFFVYRGLIRLCLRLPKTKRCKRWMEFHEDNSTMLPKLFTEQSLTLILLLLSISALISTNTVHHPFIQPQPHQLLTIIMSISIGRYLYKMALDFVLVEKNTTYLIGVIHHAVAVTCYVTIVQQRQMYLIGLLGVFMETDVICFDLSRIAKSAGISRTSRVYLGVNICGLSLCLLLRFILPFSLLTAGLSHQSLFSLNPLCTSIFFLSLVFFSIFNIYMLHGNIASLRKTVSRRKADYLRSLLHGPPRSVLVQPQEILNYSPGAVTHIVSPPDMRCVLTPEFKVTCIRNSLKLSHLPPCANANLCTRIPSPNNSQVNTTVPPVGTLPTKTSKVPVNILLATAASTNFSNPGKVNIQLSQALV